MKNIPTIEAITSLVYGNESECLSNDDLIDIYNKIQSLASIAKMIKTHIIAELQQGVVIDGYKLVPTRGRKKYTNNAEVVKRLLQFIQTNPDKAELLSKLLSPSPLGVATKTLANEPDLFSDIYEGLIDSSMVGEGLDFAPLDDERLPIKF